MSDADVFQEMRRKKGYSDESSSRHDSYQLLLRIASFFRKLSWPARTKLLLREAAESKPKKERRFMYLSDGTAIQVRLMQQKVAEDPTSLSPSTLTPLGRMVSEDIEIAVCGCRSCCTRRFPSTDVNEADLVDSSIALNMRRILAVAPKGTPPPPRYPAHLLESMTPFLASNFRPSQYLFIYRDFAIMVLTGAVTVLQTTASPDAAAAGSGPSPATQSASYYAVTVTAILTLLASSVATMTVLPFHPSKLWLQPSNAYIQAISALALINVLAGATANSPSKLVAAQAFSVVTGIACIIIFPLILLSFLFSLIGGIDFQYADERSKKLWHKSSLPSAKQKRNSWGVSSQTTSPVARLNKGDVNPLISPTIIQAPPTLPCAKEAKQNLPSVCSYSEDEIFTAGWVRTSGGALFFSKEQGRTLINDDKLPRGWAYSKSSIAQGNKKVYENLVTGECRDDFPSTELAFAAATSRRNRSFIISAGQRTHKSLPGGENSESGEATITNSV
jgi:hypothetical protein